MSRLLIYLFLGLAFAAPGEVLNQLLARHNPRAFAQTMLSYSVLLGLGFGVQIALQRLFGREARARLVFYLLYGTLGLMVEWFLLGNAPVLDPFQVVVQPGMFTYWGTFMLAPLLILEPVGFSLLKKSFLRYFAGFSAFYLLVALLVPRSKGGIFFAFIIFAAGTVALNYFYLKYFKLLSASPRNERPVPGG